MKEIKWLDVMVIKGLSLGFLPEEDMPYLTRWHTSRYHVKPTRGTITYEHRTGA